MSDFVVGSLVKPRLSFWAIPTYEICPDEQYYFPDRSGTPPEPYLVVETSIYYTRILVIKTLDRWWVANDHITCYDNPEGELSPYNETTGPT